MLLINYWSNVYLIFEVLVVVFLFMIILFSASLILKSHLLEFCFHISLYFNLVISITAARIIRETQFSSSANYWTLYTYFLKFANSNMLEQPSANVPEIEDHWKVIHKIYFNFFIWAFLKIPLKVASEFVFMMLPESS